MGHVHRGVRDAASTDLACPLGQVEVAEIGAMRFEATGCAKKARYEWVDGRPVREADDD